MARQSKPKAFHPYGAAMPFFLRGYRGNNMRDDFEWGRLEEAFQEYYPDLRFTNGFVTSLWKSFTSSFTDDVLVNFMVTACENTETSEHALRYFCAICWRRIKSGDVYLAERRSEPRDRHVDVKQAGQAEKVLH
jgi:hypothetical protein